MNWKTIYDFVLAAVFLLAAHKIMVAAMEGKRQIRVFRYVGVAMSMLWSVFFLAHAIDDVVDVLSQPVFNVASRILVSLLAVMLLTWGFLFNEKKWPR